MMKHKPEWLIEREVVLEGQTIIYSYDKEGDILEIFFQQGQGGLGIDLNENIVLRYNRDSQEPLSLILIGFSQLSHPTKFGPPSFRLTALAELPADMGQTVLRMLTSSPVNYFLKVSGLFPAPGGELQPIAYFEPPVELLLDKVLV